MANNDSMAHDVLNHMADCGQHEEVIDILYKLTEKMTAGELSTIWFDAETYYQATFDTDYLDVERDYDCVEKHYPVVSFATKDGRVITNPRAFAKHCMDELGITDADLSDVDTKCEYDSVVSFTYRDEGWTWIDEGQTDPLGDVIYYTFGGALGDNNHPLVPFVVGTVEMY